MPAKRGYRLTPEEKEAISRDDSPAVRRPWTAVLPLTTALVLTIGLGWLIFGFLTWKYRQKQIGIEPQQTVTLPQDPGSYPENIPTPR